MLDVLLTSCVFCILMGISIPGILVTVDRSRGAAAVRYLAGRMTLARAQAVARSTVVALHFDVSARGTRFSVVGDGDGDGVRTADIEDGIDRVIEQTVLLSDLFPGVSIGLSPQTPGEGAVQLGGTMILSFTPRGTATSGTVYVLGRDGTQWVVRVLGVTARARVLRFVAATGAWINAD